MNAMLKNVNATLKTENRILINHREATYNILGFDKLGKIFYGG